jgi:uncharacterized membrane protein YuzA (DUF378 family)
MRILRITAFILTVIGAINWGMVGLFQIDLVATLFNGSDSMISRIIYSIIGIAGLINIGLLLEPFDDRK